jgi:glycosyltransferase involved in cell wall biosynthesis
MRLSVIVTTYNQPAWLEKVLWGFSAQTFQDFELLIADDGSDQVTRDTIERLRSTLQYPVRHIWHEHRGFRKCEILNKAIIASESDYVFFTDGDCIPRRDLLEVHHRLARRGRFLSGGYLKLPLQISEWITREDINAGRATDYRWLRSHGVPRTRQLVRLRWGRRTAAILDRLTPTGPTWNGHNASTWRDDLFRVNGFDERMEWGGLDRELGERLENAGIRGKQIRHRAIVVHLDHPRGYKKHDAIARNREIRDETARHHVTRTPAGLDRHITPSPAPSK